MVNNIKSGQVTGTGAAINVNIGFKPSVVMLFNTSGGCFLIWVNGMGAGYGQKTVDSGAGITDISTITSGGITQYAGTSLASEGFTIGTDTDLNVNTEVISYIAFR